MANSELFQVTRAAFAFAFVLMLALFAAPAFASVPPPSFTIASASGPEGGSVVFTITKSAAARSYSRVSFTTHGGSATSVADFVAKTVTITFSNNQLVQTVAVQTLQDNLVEGAETFTVTIAPVRFATIAVGTATGTIIDDDPPLPPAPPPTQTCPDGSVIPASSVCPSPPPPGTAVALAACPSLTNGDLLVVGQSYTIVGTAHQQQPGDPPTSEKNIVILNDATHLGDGYFGLYVPISCVVAG